MSQSVNLSGFNEVVISVSNLEESLDFYQNTLGYELRHRGIANKSQNQIWQIPASCDIEEVLLGNLGDQTGCIRLLEFHNIPQVHIRPGGQSWDTGGIFDFNLRTTDLEASYTHFLHKGWNSFSEPIRYQFGPFDVSEVLLRGPDNVVIALMERHAPPLEGFPNMKQYSHAFNSTHICKDEERTRQFFIEQLGWEIYLQTESTERQAGPNVLGFPHNINPTLRLPVFIVHPNGKNQGSLEFISIKGLEGSDFSKRAHPPNLGILMYRFPVGNIEKYAAQIQQKGVTLNIPLSEYEMAPYGRIKLFGIQSPDGVWMEFIESQF